MNLSEKLMLGLNTTVISMGIVFLVLIALSIIITIQYRTLKALGFIKDNIEKPVNVFSREEGNSISSVPQPLKQTGLTRGEAELVGVGDEEQELVAVVMAAVSSASNIPISSLRIRSIKRVDSNWSNTSKQEMVNQRL